jgi:polysaccharide deacetylase 2 family uncharacterized protein YibQ
LVVSALALFLIAEAYRFTRSESGQMTLARHLGLGDAAHVTRLVGHRLREALEKAGVPPDSVSERVVEGHDPQVVWRVGLRPEASSLQLNYDLSRSLEKQGATVLSGREGWTVHGGRTLILRVGLPRRATHEVQVVQLPHAIGRPAVSEPARIAIVLFGLGDNPAAADSFFRVAAPFAVALPPDLKTSRETLRAAHQRGREVVLHLPLEPINYPQVNPGPGTLLVTMKPARIADDVHHFLDQSRPIAAVANHMGSLATQDMTLMRAVFHELRREDLPFLHVTPAAGAVCKSLAADMGIDYAEPDMMIDQEARSRDTRALEKRWKEVLTRARSRGHLIVWLRATPLTREWLPRVLTPKELGGASVVPLAALIRRPVPE